MSCNGGKVRVTAESTELRVGDATLANPRFGELLEVVTQQGQWVRVVASEGGVRGWVPWKELLGGPDEGTPRPGQTISTLRELDVTVDQHVLATLPAGIRISVMRVENERVEVQAVKQDVARFKGAKLVFEPALEGWVRRDHAAKFDGRPHGLKRAKPARSRKPASGPATGVRLSAIG